MAYYKRKLPMMVTFTFGMLFITEYFIEYAPYNALVTELRNWTLIVTALSILISVITFTLRFSKNLSTSISESDVGNIITNGTALTLFAMAVFTGILYGTSSPFFRRIYMAVFTPSHATLWAMNCFFLASACWRAFKAKHVDSIAMLLCAAVTMLYLAPVGGLIWGGWTPIYSFINDSFLKAGQRGIAIGGAIGTISIGLRVIFGFERAYLGERGEGE